MSDYDNSWRDEGPSYLKLSMKRVKARKLHTCDACRKPIEAGTFYYRHACIYDGKFEMHRFHWPNQECAFYEEGADAS